MYGGDFFFSDNGANGEGGKSTRDLALYQLSAIIQICCPEMAPLCISSFNSFLFFSFGYIVVLRMGSLSGGLYFVFCSKLHRTKTYEFNEFYEFVVLE